MAPNAHALRVFALAALLGAVEAVSRQPGVPEVSVGKGSGSRRNGEPEHPLIGTEAAAADFVKDLPGWTDGQNDLFGGYVTVDEASQRDLYYIMAESMDNPLEDPVVLWLNGGPGCSSLGGGLFSELGPFFPKKDGSGLEPNQYPWNEHATVIFLESPALVGFSYSANPDDHVTGDEQTAQDSLKFLLGFFERYPALRRLPFWISGESYAGHYVPNLAAAVLAANENAANEADKINLTGILVGNAWTDAVSDNGGALGMWEAYALISRATAALIDRECNLAHAGPLGMQFAKAQAANALPRLEELAVQYDAEERKPLPPQTAACTHALYKAFEEMGGINIYDIFVDVCKASTSPFGELDYDRDFEFEPDQKANKPKAPLHEKGAARHPSQAHSGDWPYDPCIDYEVAQYLNQPAVQAAIHANVTGVVTGPWASCTDAVKYDEYDKFSSMIPTYHVLMDANLRILVYSGDVDAIVPTAGTRNWIEKLDLDIVNPWRPWYTHSQQVAGHVETYNGLTFASVRNAGHMVPYTQPHRAWHLFNRFIRGEEL